jgi:hypothetical protein
MKPIVKKAAIFIGIFITIVLLGLLAIIITYKLPNGKVKKHIEESLSQFKDEGLYFRVESEFYSSQLDNFTDALILNELYYTNNNRTIIDKAMNVYSYSKTANNPVDALIKNVEEKIENRIDDGIESPYARYWHGNLVVLKVLFAFFNYSEIKMLNYLVQIALVIVVIYLMQKKNLKNFIIPFLISLFLINAMIIPLSLQFSTVFYILLISLIVMLLLDKIIISKKLYLYLFLIIGMLTSYFDFLTYPLVTLGIPLIFLLLLDKSNSYKKIIICTLSWGFGYVGMWASKWAVGSILLKRNLFEDAILQIKYRSSSEEFNRFNAILKNFKIYNYTVYKLIFTIIILYYLIRIIKLLKKLKIKYIKKIIPFLIIAVMPMVWYFLASNHSSIHYWFTFRALIIFFFAIMSALEEVILDCKSNE